MASGSDILAMIERMLGDTRGELDGVAAKLERSSAELEHARQSELGALAVLARIRLKEIEAGQVVEALDDTGKRVTDLLAQRADAQAAVGTELGASQDALGRLEHDRAAQHAVVGDAEKAVGAAEADAQARLKADASYGAQLGKAQASDGVADLADAKAQAARTDRVEKGKVYEADALFGYLWSRGFGTSRYRAGALTRLLDRWVARVAGFEPLRRDYWMLSSLPARFDDHAQRMRALADADVGVVQALEHTAAEAAGVPARHKTLDTAEHELASVDEKIHAREAEIAALVEKRASFAAGEDDLSRQCTDLLSDAFRKEQMRALRERANSTPGPEDDAAVDQLTVIRTELPRLEEEVARYRSLHDAQRKRATDLEEVRKRFKEHRFDAVSSEFVNGALIATLLTQLLGGGLRVPAFWDALARQQRYRSFGADPRFGSGGFPRLPGGGPWRPPGGFGGRGGFGGGGFRTGGGFGGGGGFRTGGGF